MGSGPETVNTSATVEISSEFPNAPLGSVLIKKSTGIELASFGITNMNQVGLIPVMSNDTTPSPFVVTAVDKYGANAWNTMGTYRLFDNDPATDARFCGRYLLFPNGVAVSNKEDGTVGLAYNGHGIAVGSAFNINNLTGYTANYTVHANTTENEIIFTATYAGATTSSTYLSVAPSEAMPCHVCFDLGNYYTVNKFRVVQGSGGTGPAFPNAFTFWGSLASSPVKHTNTEWVQLFGMAPWIRESLPGSGASRDYYVENATAFRHYRWTITGRAGTTFNVACPGDFQLYAVG